MTRIGLARTAIVIAGTGTAAMGAFHFALPALFGWASQRQVVREDDVVFRVFNAGYQIVRPFPPPRIRWVLLGCVNKQRII